MQIKVFNIPIPGGEALNEEMNVFLRSKKIISVEDQVVQSGNGAFWCYSIRYIDDLTISDRDKPKVDYRQVLDEETFKRFSALRDIRKKVAKDDAVPAYVVFSDEELAELAKLDPLTEAGMKNVKGIGEKKVEKYGHYSSICRGMAAVLVARTRRRLCCQYARQFSSAKNILPRQTKKAAHLSGLPNNNL